MRTINDNCNNCGQCIEECPENAISSGVIHRIDREKCTDCMACVPACVRNAIVEYVEPVEEPVEETDL